MLHTLNELLQEEAGFIVSAELVLVATLVVIGLIVGLSEVQHSVVSELNDVGEAIGRLNQSFEYSGFRKYKDQGGVAAFFRGSYFVDKEDECDCNQCDIACDYPRPEAWK